MKLLGLTLFDGLSSTISSMASCLYRAFLATSLPHLIVLSAVTTAFTPQFTRLNMSSSTTTNEQKSYIDKLALILINSKRQQLVARSYGKEVFYTPGGKREKGETDLQALVRECKEELDTDLLTSTKTTASIEPYGVFEAQAYGKPDGTMVRMQCYRVTPVEAELELERLVTASEEVEELMWIDSTFNRSKLTVTGIMILDDLHEKGFIK